MPSLKCPHCSRVLRVGETAAGKQITCPACKQKFLAPRPPGARGPAKPPPVHGADRPWHLHVGGRNVGPYSADAVADQLKTGKIDRNTLAWKEGMADWKPLKEIGDFRSAARSARLGGKVDDEGAPERRRRYVPGRSKRDAVMGAWIAVGLAVVLIVVILVVANRPDPNEVSTDPYEHRLQAIKAAAAARTTLTAAPTSPAPASAAAPSTKAPRIIRRPKPKLSNEKLLAKVTKEIDELFKEAFARPEEANTKPLFRLRAQCPKYAAQLRERDWGSYHRDVERYAGLLEQTANGINSKLTFLSQKWHPDVSIDPKIKAKDYAEDIAFLRNWETAVNEALAKIRGRGLKF